MFHHLRLQSSNKKCTAETKWDVGAVSKFHHESVDVGEIFRFSATSVDTVPLVK